MHILHFFALCRDPKGGAGHNSPLNTSRDVHVQWLKQNFRKGRAKRVARNLEREIKPDENDEGQKKGLDSDLAWFSSQI